MSQDKPQEVQEFIGNTPGDVSRRYITLTTRYKTHWMKSQVTWERSNYAFWRKAYLASAKGLEVSGLFLKPLINKIAAWTFGRAPQWRMDNEATADDLNEWWSDWHPTILSAVQDSLRLGDSFIVVNGDLSVTVLPPEAVHPIVDEQDYGNIVGWRVIQELPHPDRPGDKMTMTDEYMPEGRTQIIEKNGVEIQRITFPNLLPEGLLPILHIPNRPEGGRIFGRPEPESLVPTLHRYGETIDAGLDGNHHQGRPTPVLTFDNVADVQDFWDRYGTTERRELADGTVEEVLVLDVDLDQLLTVSAADFKYESPGAFMSDTVALLEILFYLILEHTELPEFVFGNAITSSKASAEVQLPVFVRFIEMKQGEMAKWLMQLAQVVLGYMTFVSPGTAVEEPTLQWAEIADDDGNLLLETVKWAFTEGLLDRETALSLAPINVDNIEEVLTKADEEAEERLERFALPAPETFTSGANEGDAAQQAGQQQPSPNGGGD